MTINNLKFRVYLNSGMEFGMESGMNSGITGI